MVGAASNGTETKASLTFRKLHRAILQVKRNRLLQYI